MADPQKKYRSFTGVLYPDSTTYDCNELLKCLPDVFDEYGFILHDSDKMADGSPKKEHIHWVGRRKNGVMVKTIAKQMGLRDTEVEYVKHGWRAAVRYLIHIDHPEKFQYSPEQVSCSFDYSRFLADELSSEDMAKGIFEYLCKSQCMSSIELTRWCIDNGYWSEERRAFPLWAAIMTEFKSNYSTEKKKG